MKNVMRRHSAFLARILALCLCAAILATGTGMSAVATEILDDGDGTQDAGQDEPGTGITGSENDTEPGPWDDGGAMDGGDALDDGSPEYDAAEDPGFGAFDALYEAFEADYLGEKCGHGTYGHVCAFRDFVDVLERYEAVIDSVADMTDGRLDELDKMLSRIAVGTYRVQAEDLGEQAFESLAAFDGAAASVGLFYRDHMAHSVLEYVIRDDMPEIQELDDRMDGWRTELESSLMDDMMQQDAEGPGQEDGDTGPVEDPWEDPVDAPGDILDDGRDDAEGPEGPGEGDDGVSGTEGPEDPDDGDAASEPDGSVMSENALMFISQCIAMIDDAGSGAYDWDKSGVYGFGSAYDRLMDVYSLLPSSDLTRPEVMEARRRLQETRDALCLDNYRAFLDWMESSIGVFDMWGYPTVSYEWFRDELEARQYELLVSGSYMSAACMASDAVLSLKARGASLLERCAEFCGYSEPALSDEARELLDRADAFLDGIGGYDDVFGLYDDFRSLRSQLNVMRDRADHSFRAEFTDRTDVIRDAVLSVIRTGCENALEELAEAAVAGAYGDTGSFDAAATEFYMMLSLLDIEKQDAALVKSMDERCGAIRDVVMDMSGLSDDALDFIYGVSNLWGEFNAGGYRNDQYGLKQACSAMDALLGGVPGEDLADPDVQAAAEWLCFMRDSIALHPDAEAYIGAGSDLLEGHRTMSPDDFDDAIGELARMFAVIWNDAMAATTEDAYRATAYGMNQMEITTMSTRLSSLDRLMAMVGSLSNFIRNVEFGCYVDDFTAAISVIELFDRFVAGTGVERPGVDELYGLMDDVMEIKYNSAARQFRNDARALKLKIEAGKFNDDMDGLDGAMSDAEWVFSNMRDSDRAAMQPMYDSLSALAEETKQAYYDSLEPSEDAGAYVAAVREIVRSVDAGKYDGRLVQLWYDLAQLDIRYTLTDFDLEQSDVIASMRVAEVLHESMYVRLKAKYEDAAMGSSVFAENLIDGLYAAYVTCMDYILAYDYMTESERMNCGVTISEHFAYLADGGVDVMTDPEFEDIISALRLLDVNGYIFERQPGDFGAEYTIYPLPACDGYTVYDAIGRQADDFASYCMTMEGALGEAEGILCRIRELAVKGLNATLTEADIESINAEIRQLYQALIWTVETTYFDHVYGLTGRGVEFQVGWQDVFGEPLLSITLSDLRETVKPAAEICDKLMARDDSCLEDIDGMLPAVRTERMKLGAKQNMADTVARWAHNMDAALAFCGASAGSVTSIPKTDYAFPETDPDRVLGSTLDNVTGLKGMIQVAEATLSDAHMIQQRQMELLTQLSNATDGELLVHGCRFELQELNRALAYISMAASYDGYHMLYRDGRAVCPTGWAGLCHDRIVIGFENPSDRMLDYDALDGQAAPYLLDALSGYMDYIGTVRNVLGANQNGIIHVEDLCEQVLRIGPMVGNQFGIDEATGHHTLDHMTDSFLFVVEDMISRQSELQRLLRDGVFSDHERELVMMEYRTINDYMDILVDLLSVDTGGLIRVREAGEFVSAWTSELLLDENGLCYDYQLSYTSTRSDTKNVCIVDYLEDGDGTVWAGVLRGVDLGDAYGQGLPVEVYANLYGMEQSDAGLPDVLPSGTAWTRIDPEIFKDWNKVYAIAFYFGDTVFGPEQAGSGAGSNGVEIVLNMQLSYGGKAGSVEAEMPDDGYRLTNHVWTYERVGTEAGVPARESEAFTTVTLKYPVTSVRVPVTGGPGTTAYYIFGTVLLAMPAAAIVYKKRKEGAEA